MSQALKDIKQGNYQFVKRESGKSALINSYLTTHGVNVQYADTILGPQVRVNGVEMNKFTAWRYRRAIRKSSQR